MKEIVYKNPWFSVVKDNKWHYIVEKNSNNGAVILILKDNKKFIFVKNYRRAIDSVVIELPRGYGENSEDSLSTAIRESYEETGYQIAQQNLKKIGSINPNSAILTSCIDIYLAHVTLSDLKKKHDNEVIELVEIDINEIMDMISTGLVKDAFSLSAISLYLSQNYNKTQELI